MKEKITFEHRTKAHLFLWQHLKAAAYKWLTKNSSHYFMLGGDSITTLPSTSGFHEPHLTGLINHLADQGYNDFLVDIGANIGLISGACGNKFKRVTMYEPNPIIASVARSNVCLNLKTPFDLIESALARDEKTRRLSIPLGNMGGAYILDQDNSYDEKVLMKKEGALGNNDIKLMTVDIKCIAAEKELSRLFEQYRAEGFSSGIIKVDVEGYEEFIISSLLSVIPRNFSAVIIAESWQARDLRGKIKSSLNGPVVFAKLCPKKNWWGASKLLKTIQMCFRGRYEFNLLYSDFDSTEGEDVIFIN